MARSARLALAAAIGLALAMCVSGLDPATPLSQYGHDVWTSDSGLPQNSITTVVQARDGYLWLGTQEGLVRFDGVRFEIFDTRNTPALNDDWVQALLPGRDGTLWIGTVTGLVRYRDGVFAPEERGGLSRAIVEALFESRDGSVWVGSEQGVSRIDAESVRTFTTADGLPNPRVRAIAQDSRGDVWVGGTWGLARLANGRFEPWKPAVEAAAEAKDADAARFGVFALLGEPEGGLWVGTNRGLARVQGRSARFHNDPVGMTHNLVRALFRDRDTNLWLATDGGLYRFRDGELLRHGTAEGLSSNRILSIGEDREGSLWVGTSDGGLNRIKEQRIAIYTGRDGLPDDKIWSVFEDSRGNLWAGSADGILSRLAPGAERFEHAADLGASVMAIAEDRRGGLWVGTRGAGLVHFTGGRRVRYTTADGLSGNWISSVLVDRRGTVWAASMGSGINRFERGRFVNFRARDGLGADAVFSLFEDRGGAIWIGTFGGGVTRWADGAFRTFTTKDGLPHDVVMSTYQDSDGTYWFATRGGLGRYRGGRFTTYRQREGVFHDAAQRVLEDGRGYLWLTSNRGVFRISQAELAAAAPGPGRIPDRVTFTTATGMIRAECNNAQHGAWRSRDGRLWFATVKGLAMADPSRIELNPVPPAVVLERVVADGQALPVPGALTLPPGTRKLEFGYTALAFRNPLAVRFRYRLEGFEKDWVEAGPRRAAYYTSLPPGRYRFQVLAANEDGVWNESGAAAELVLERRFWQTTWFRALAVSAAALLATLLYRLRVRRLEVRERLRTALVEAQLDALQFQLRPHFLFNTLNSILPLVGRDPERARQMVVRLGDLLRVSLRSEETPLVTLQEEIAILEKYLSIEKVRFRDRLEVTIAVTPEVAAASVPSFLLQPLVENAIKHGLGGRAGKGRIVVTARPEGTSLWISVQDNGPGPGTDAGAAAAGVGLRNTRRRLEALYPGAHFLELRRSAEGGGEVRIRVPISLGHAAAQAVHGAPVAKVARFPRAS